MSRSARRGSLWTVAVIAIVMVSGHICVLPAHGPIEAATEQAEDQHTHQGDEAIHAASCEGLPSPSTVSPVLPGGSSPVVMVSPISLRPTLVNQGRCAHSLKSPPLFLLHASLLI